MTRKMTYTKLMKLVDDGDASINAWSNDEHEVIADVTFYKSNGTSKREYVEVAKLPKDF